MAHIERTVLIEAPVEQVFNYAANVARLPEWWASLVEVRNYRQEQVVVGLTYDWVYKMMGMRFDGRGEVVEVVPNERFKIKNEGGIPSTIEDRFVREGDKTRYTIVVDYTIPGSLLGKVADKVFLESYNEKEADHIVANLKSICEAAKASA